MIIVNFASNIIFQKAQGMIIQTILEMQANVYPFNEAINKGSKGMVQELEYFETNNKLLQKKDYLKRHMKGIQSNFIIKLLKIYEQELCLHYIYQYVPFSLSSYIKNQLSHDEYDKFKEMTAKLLLRKITNDINAIVTELTKMRIEIDLSYEMLGAQSNKIKIFIGSHFQVGRKSELLLKQQYKPRKEMVLKKLQEQFARIINEAHDTPNFIIKGNRLLFSNNKKQSCNPYNNYTQSIYSQSIDSSFCLNDTYINCQTKDSNMNNTKEKERRYSQTKWDANQWRRYEKQPERLRNTQSPAFINNINLDTKSKMAASNHFDDASNSEDDNFDGKSYCHSKSIRIELEKNKKDKRRKDSYTVKIITCHQYEMDDINPKDIFQKCNISDSQSFDSHRPNKHKYPNKKQFQQKVHKATQKAKQILSGYLHKRRNSRK